MHKTTVVAVLSLMLAGPVAGQEKTTTVEHVRAMLDDLRDWPPDSEEIPKKRAQKWRKDKKNRKRYAQLFAEGGELQSIEFIDTFDYGDVYLIEFENARVLLRYTRHPKERWAWAAMIQLRTTTDEYVRRVLDDLRDWPPDSEEIPKKIARKWSKDKNERERYARLFGEGGELQSIEFIGAFDHGDMYLIEFENARAMVRYVREPRKRWNWRAVVRVPR